MGQFIKTKFDMEPMNADDSNPSGTPGMFMTEKMDVNGDNTGELWRYLKGFYPGKTAWSFASNFLISRQGIPCFKSGAMTSWATIEAEIKKLLAEEKAEL